MKKQILGIVLCLCMLFSLIVFALPAAADEATPITSAADYTALMNDSSMWGGSYILTADIDLDGVTLTPIGDATTPFSGTFDGDGHTVSGITLTGPSVGLGLFGYLTGTVQDLTVDGTVTNTDTTSASSTSYSGTGGIVGMAYGTASIIGCTNNANVTGVHKVGGIVGFFTETSAGSDMLIRGCVNNGDVSGNSCVGGIIGRVALSTSGGAFTATQLKNAGTITGTGSYAYEGGIIGFFTDSGKTATVSECYNTGAVNASKLAGGIVGYTRLYTGAANKVTFENLMNAGTITEDGALVAGIICTTNANASTANNFNCTVSCTYNIGEVTTTNATKSYTKAIVGRYGSKQTSFSAGYYTSTTGDDRGTYVSEPTKKTSFPGFDFEDVWSMGTAGPELTAFHTHNATIVTGVGNEGHRFDCTCGYHGEVVPHTFDGGVCSVCGAVETSCAHENTHDVITTAATCMSTGLKNVVCDDCEQVVYTNVEVPIDASNHVGTLYMDFNHGGTNAIDYCCNACNNVVIADTSSATDIYVATTGNTVAFGNVSAGNLLGTSANPFANFNDAIQYAAYSATRRAGGVTLHIVDDATPSGSNYQTPACNYMITITGGTLHLATRFILTGPVTLEHLDINTSSAAVFAARCRKFVVGEGVTINNPSIIVGGFEQNVGGAVPDSGFVTDVTIRSGEWTSVFGASRFATVAGVTGPRTTGTIKMTIGKTDPADTLDISMSICMISSGDSKTVEPMTTASVLLDLDGEFTGTPKIFPGGNVATTADYTTTVLYRSASAIGEISTVNSAVTDLTVYPDLTVTGTGTQAAAIVAGFGGEVGSICEYYGTAHVDANTDNACDKCGATIAYAGDAMSLSGVYSNGDGKLRFVTRITTEAGDPEIEYFGTYIVPLSYFTANELTAGGAEQLGVGMVKYTQNIEGGRTFAADLTDIPAEAYNEPIYAWSFVKFAGIDTVSVQVLGSFALSDATLVEGGF